METKDVIELIKSIRHMFIVQAAMVGAYDWGADYSLKTIKKTYNNEGKLPDTPLKLEQLKCIPRETLHELGFFSWDKDGIVLIPLYMVNYLDPEMEVTCIFGTKTLLKDADNDVRYGCIAYGFMI